MQLKYKVINPSQKDLGLLIPQIRVAQKYREGENKGGPEKSGIIWGSNTNLGIKWYLREIYQGNIVAMPLNNRDHLGDRAMPQFKINALFRLDNQP
jgi:hypothetical protein